MEQKFSQKLAAWLKTKGSKTFGELEVVFAEKSFAVAFLILMVPSALPIPTGGLTHVFSIISMLLSLEMVFGRQTIWTPKFWKERDIGKALQDKALPKLVSFIAWFERWSRQRSAGVINHGLFTRLVGVTVFIFSLAAAVAPPFTGLDTLPALAVVLVSLALILDDILILPIALIAGSIGVFLLLTLGRATLHLLF